MSTTFSPLAMSSVFALTTLTTRARSALPQSMKKETTSLVAAEAAVETVAHASAVIVTTAVVEMIVVDVAVTIVVVAVIVLLVRTAHRVKIVHLVAMLLSRSLLRPSSTARCAMSSVTLVLTLVAAVTTVAMAIAVVANQHIVLS